MQIDQRTSDATLNLALDTLDKKKQALVFCGSKASTEKQAEVIAKKIKDVALVNLSESIRKVLPAPTKQCERLSKCVLRGTAFHHSGLHSKQRALIEDAFREGKISIICCTPTLAAGIDLPAFRTILKDLKRYGGRFGMQYIPVLEYLQMAGRAGRPGYEDFGESICVAKSDGSHDEIWERYILGVPEDIHSKLAVEPVLRTYLLSLISTEYVRTKKQIMDFFSETFWAHQFKDLYELEKIIDKMLTKLAEWEFLQKAGASGEFVSGDSLVGEKYDATPLGRRVAELYIDPLTAHDFVVGLRRTGITVKNISYLHLICNSYEMYPPLRVKNKEWDLLQEELVKYHPYLLVEEPSVYEPEFEDYFNAFKTAMMLDDWCDEKKDGELLEKYNCRPGESRAKIERGYWLLFCAAEIARMIGKKGLVKDINKTRFRLRNGVKEELLPLLKLEGIGRVRARTLFANRIKTLKNVKEAPIITLAQLIGGKLAASVKKQMGVEVKEIPKGRRKGQTSLSKYD
ncbi:MAG: helicase-related protein [Candidatus Nanoarchaeia archaeon]